jgi:DNA-binding transcriptional MerR regulator
VLTVEKSEITYSANQVAQQIDVKPVTLRAWCKALEEAGYKIMRDEQGNRLYTERDISALRQLSEYMNKNLEWDQATKLIIDEFSEQLLPLANPQETHHPESNEMARTIQETNETLQQMREAMKQQREFYQELIKRLDERDRYIEDSVNHRDEQMMTAARTIQEMNGTLQQMREAMKQQREFNQELIKILDETDRYIEDSVNHRDEQMMTVLQEIQENTRLEIAAAREQQEEKQPWWQRLLGK